MTYKTFKSIANKYRPELEVYQHSKFAETDDHSVEVIYPSGKCYKYRGTYIEVLTKLKCPVVLASDIARIKAQIESYKETDGKQSCFGFIIDNTRVIKEYQDLLDSYAGYEVIDF